MKKNLREIIDTCIGGAAAGLLLGVAGYYCLRTLGNSSSHKREPLALNERYNPPGENILPYMYYPADELYQDTISPLDVPRPPRFDGPMRKENLPSDRKEK